MEKEEKNHLIESTSNLNTESDAHIPKSSTQLVQGKTTTAIAHRLSTIKKAYQILVIETGSIVRQGTHETLIVPKWRYCDLFTYHVKIL